MDKTPYLKVVDMPRMMKGEGAPRSTTFGVLGRTKESPLSKSLGGLVMETTKGKVPNESFPASRAYHNTEHHIIGAASKTKVSGMHYGQVPYPGAFMAHLGAMVH